MQLYFTKSVCPVCLRTLTAEISGDADGVYMDKTCPEHGHFHSLIWEDSAENYLRWLEYGGMRQGALPKTAEEAERVLAGADFADCACCQPASSALMTTNRCNMDCPVCFTRDKKEPIHEPDLETCGRLLREYRARAGEDAIVELCGGEPTVREDICELASLARDIGFDFIQLNTNGINLAKSPKLCRRLRESGVTTAYLGFDALTEKPYFAKYGKPMFEIKKRAVENAAEAGLAVILVCCVIPGENDGDLGGIVEYAKANMPAVKGVYFQPVSYFGRCELPEPETRLTIPRVIREIEAQTGGAMKFADFSGGSSFQAWSFSFPVQRAPVPRREVVGAEGHHAALGVGLADVAAAQPLEVQAVRVHEGHAGDGEAVLHGLAQEAVKAVLVLARSLARAPATTGFRTGA